ncbi:MAG: UDP-N-acetylmuramate dehydrogenase [Bacteroidetes bacterium]|nr:UDP-N-acetylmuramate dehydrogenase [Bacteroidota bacterium]
MEKRLQQNVSLKEFNTFGIDVQAKYFSRFSNQDELEESLAQNKSSTFILGGGSNILLTRNFDGLILKNEIKGIDIIKEDEHHLYVRAGAGENWHQFVQYCIQRNLAGVENLSLIPGSVGASPMQNIGAYGVEVKEVFDELEAYHLKEKKVYTFSVNDCEFGYRESIFKKKLKDQLVILSVTYRLNKVPAFNTSYGAVEQELEKMGVTNLSIQAISQAVINIRSSKLPDPAEIGNAGSFFKNPQISKSKFVELRSKHPELVAFENSDGTMKLAAGWMIEQCGWKGYRKGDAGCHAKQALVLVNYGNASGKEIYTLSEEITKSVKKKFGVELEREVNVV